MKAIDILIRSAALAFLLLVMAGTPPVLAAPMDERQALHLLNRLGYGPAPGDLARLRGLDAATYVDSQLAPPTLPTRLEARLAELVHPGMPALEETLTRAIASPRQLEEVLTAFWTGYFIGQGEEADARAARAALRPHVLGRYGELRRALAGQARAGSERDALRALTRHFVDAPSTALQRSLGRVWDTTQGDQRAVLRALFTSREFLAPAQWNGKRKDDFRFIVSAVRASGLAVENAAPLAEWLDRPMGPAERDAFAQQLAGGRLALAMAPPPPHRQASSAPPLRASVAGDGGQGEVARPGPILMEAPTPSARAMAAAARSEPADAGRLLALLRSEVFRHY